MSYAREIRDLKTLMHAAIAWSGAVQDIPRSYKGAVSRLRDQGYVELVTGQQMDGACCWTKVDGYRITDAGRRLVGRLIDTYTTKEKL